MGVYVTSKSVPDLRRKIAAFRTLYEKEPVVMAWGTFIDEKGKDVCIYAAARNVTRVGKKYAIVGDEQSGLTKIRATPKGSFSLELPFEPKEPHEHHKTS